MRKHTKIIARTIVLAAAGWFASCNSTIDKEPNVVLEVETLTVPPITSSANGTNGACTYMITAASGTFKNKAKNQFAGTSPFNDIILLNAERVLRSGVKASDLWYSFGIQHPGAVCLHNYPRFLQDLTLPDGVRLDLGAVDIMRDRERGVPRYCQFRRLLHLNVPTTFEELTDNPVWAAELKEMYKGDIERGQKVDFRAAQATAQRSERPRDNPPREERGGGRGKGH
jgi:hypothetical protein